MDFKIASLKDTRDSALEFDQTMVSYKARVVQPNLMRKCNYFTLL